MRAALDTFMKLLFSRVHEGPCFSPGGRRLPHQGRGLGPRAQLLRREDPRQRAFLEAGDISPGIFIAAVGADNREKQEFAPSLLASSMLVVDVLDQCAEIGDLHTPWWRAS